MTDLTKQIEMITAADIAEVCKLSVKHVADRLTRSEGFPTPYRIGGARRWDRKEFIHWLNQQRIK